MSTEKDSLLEKFSALSSSIVNMPLLHRYLDFCLTQRLPNKLVKESTSHHILPMAKTLPFKQWSDLTNFSWNKAELTYADHYKAHFLLANAIDHIAIYHAFAAMHKKDFVLGRITESDLICSDEFSAMWNKRNEKISQRRLEIIIVDGKEMTRAAFYAKNRILSDKTRALFSFNMSGDKNPSKNANTLLKIRDTKKNTYIDGENLNIVSAKRAAETMKKEFIKDAGIFTA
jgi:hypothetical protein